MTSDVLPSPGTCAALAEHLRRARERRSLHDQEERVLCWLEAPPPTR